MKVVTISDTHGMHDGLTIPQCDVLIVAGDICRSGNTWQLEEFSDWLSGQSNNFKKCLLVSGNHDWVFAKTKLIGIEILKNYLGDKIEYLQDQEIVIDGIKFYGSPWQPEFNSWAFNLPRGDRLKLVWEAIPDDVNVLITHCPPHGIGDLVVNSHNHAGCFELLNRIKQLSKNSLKLSVFGHIHSGNGLYTSDELKGVIFCNTAICDERYKPNNSAYEFNIDSNLYVQSKAIKL
jgi:Icc-related predicted phosphoesterase